MGLVYRATVTPTKQQLLEAWLPSQPWAEGVTLTDKLGEYRFDDPEGEVGVETMLYATAAGPVVQLPVTYRAEPLEGAEEHLIGTSEHSVLGPRWVYDGCGDPVWAATLASAILTGGSQAQMYLEQDGERTDLPARVQVTGSGEPGSAVPTIATVDSVRDEGATAVVTCGDLEIVFPRFVGTAVDTDATLHGTWDGGEATLAGVRHVKAASR